MVEILSGHLFGDLVSSIDNEAVIREHTVEHSEAFVCESQHAHTLTL